MNKPESRPEKKAQYDETCTFPRWLFVHELKALLEQLEDDDWVTINKVGNLVIGRGDDHNIGIIDFWQTELDLWDEVDDE